MSGSFNKGIDEVRLPRQPVRVGGIGVGRFGENHVRAYAESPFSELVAVCDIFEDKAIQAAEEWGVPKRHAFTSVEKMLELDEIDTEPLVGVPNEIAAPGKGAFTLYVTESDGRFEVVGCSLLAKVNRPVPVIETMTSM